MAKIAFVTLNQIKPVPAQYGEYDEATGYRTVIAEAGEKMVPTVCNPTMIRCFYPRNDDKPGTRITFWDGGGFAVSETMEQIQEAIKAA